MLSSSIELLLRDLSSQGLTEIFLWGMIGVLGLSIFLKRKNRANQFTQYTPTLLTTLGILGTFAGIVSGLLGFDVNNIDGSIGTLLDGLKTAFITSLAGMFLSTSYKVSLSTGIFSAPHGNGAVDEDEIGIADLYSVMKEQTAGIDRLQASIGGDGDASLVNQLKLMRSDIKDNQSKVIMTLEPAVNNLEQLLKISTQQQQDFTQFQERLWIKMQDFADMLSKSATEQVINALKDVISDFNNNLIDQFGDNFKHLNHAVLALVEWQENYRQQLEKMIEQYQLGVQSISQTEASVSHISQETQAIPTYMQSLQGVMQVNQHQLQELERHLAAFKEVRDRAVEAIPEIRVQIDETLNGMKSATKVMTEGLKQATDTVTQGLDSSATSLRTLTNGLKEDSTKLTQSYKEASQSLIHETDTMRKQVSEQFNQIAKTHMEENNKILKGMSKNADQALKDTGEAVEKQIKMLDDALVRELNQVLNELGRALTTISGKFTSDYQKLVNEMHQVVQFRGDRRA